MEEEVTFSQLLDKVKAYLAEIKNKWILLGILGLLLGGFMVFKELRKDVIYSAEIKFMISGDDPSSASPLSGLLGQIGMGSGAPESNFNKIMQFSFSNKIFEGVLLDSIVIDNKNDLFGNHIIELFSLSDERFKSSSLEAASREERTLFKKVKRHLSGNANKEGVIQMDFRENSRILSLLSTSANEELTIALVTSHFEKLSSYYKTSSNAKQTAGYKQLKQRVDSLEQELSKAEYGAASKEDRSLGLVRQQSRVPVERLNRKAAILSGLYSEALVNLERANMLKSQNEAFFTIVEEPFVPLDKTDPQPLMRGIVGFILGVMMGVIFVAIRKFFGDILA